MGEIRGSLEKFWTDQNSLYSAIFESGVAIADVPAEIAALPFVDLNDGMYESRIKIFRWESDHYGCDWKRGRPDEVFRPHHSEVAICASEYLPPTEGLKVLEVGAGCGIYGIRANLQKQADVLARDVNQRAIRFASRNAHWNGARRIHQAVGSLFDGLEPIFDFVILGLPYQPTPPFENSQDYCDGGDDGSDLLRRAIGNLDQVLAESGQAVACFGSLGDDSRSALSEDLPDALPNGIWRASVSHLQQPVPFRGWREQKTSPKPNIGTESWLAELDAQRKHMFHYCVVRIELVQQSAKRVVDIDFNTRAESASELFARA